MKDERYKQDIAILIKEIENGLEVLDKIDVFFQDYKNKENIKENKNLISAIVVADIFVNFYTCLETIFLRISQFFENRLKKDKWHQDLLDKMILEIEDVRMPAIQKETKNILIEFLKFRHFKGYYFEFNYD